ncbi:uncharacterized protein GGS22DRAFT_107131 [Annulohypoxylon maeteangense]|uniref:uncharacterized protein n=1 Tax=Annulohypoxylon maeteangense TaxID=1927788 RepID=UPI0020075F43|nr:uncharacterized protein GGS22DRAFT_107131 [Annulohypoxylon maeteangense]KAI0887286.1 hypothetical protein GGS22DRAFT_107131 [Annulohypoxylon maeteangense]
MRFSKALQSSPHSCPSPDGELIATLLPSSIVIRTIISLDVLRTIKLPQDLTTGVTTSFLWSPSSTRILVAITDQIHVFSARSGDFHGVIRIPPSIGRSTFIDFGATDHEVCIWSPFGIKLTLINLTSSKAVEITNPKFYSAATATKGISFRPKTKHLALLTRTSGKDMISIHSPGTRELQRSWYPDTIDAQGLVWTADGRWLVVCESSAQSPRVLFYTSDGHIFKDWNGPLLHAPQDMGLLSTGVKAFTLSPDCRLAAVANSSPCICILNTPSMVEAMRLHHPQVIQPKDTLQIWQEQNTLPNTGSISSPGFIKATQAVTPQWTTPNNLQEPTSGCNLVKFDCSSSLLATRLEDAPGTIWIWDLPSSDLRAVLMYHANVTKLEWHPVHPELLLMRCDGDRYGSLVFAWDPLSQGPRSIDMARQFPEALSSKTYAAWIRTRAESAALFFTDHATCMVISLADSDGEALPWHEDDSAPGSPISHGSDINMQSSPKLAYELEDAEDSIDIDPDDDYASELDDTFQFISR